jgi:hypothetical protein
MTVLAVVSHTLGAPFRRRPADGRASRRRRRSLALPASLCAVSGLWALAAGCTPAPPTPRPTPVPASPPPPGAGRLAPPSVAATRPSDYPGLHNVVAYAPEVYSGSVPEGPEGFATLRRLGVRTVLSVDGMEPELAPAKAEGLRYVHLPVAYAGFDEERKLEIARAVRDLPKPIYVHCHHGKHRSAGATGAAMVTLGQMTPAEAVARMKVSGTAPEYKGLYACSAEATAVLPAVLDAVSPQFPELTRPQGTVKTMVEIDELSDNLKAVQKAGWTVPANHPDLVPSIEAGKLADHFRYLKDDKETKGKPSEYLAWLLEGSKKAEAVEAGLTAATAAAPAELDKRWAAVQASCKQCHAKYRD